MEYINQRVTTVPLKGIEKQTDDNTLELDIRYIIDNLPPKDRKVFELLYNGYNHKEIAKKLKISNKTVGKIIGHHKSKFLI